MSLDEVLNIAAQTAGTLQEAHEHNIIHWDIESENIIVMKKV
jgi:serine/threonine protein kinase